MNYEQCIESTIEDSVRDVLKRLPELSPEDRYAVLVEMCEWITSPVDVDDELIVPRAEQ